MSESNWYSNFSFSGAVRFINDTVDINGTPSVSNYKMFDFFIPRHDKRNDILHTFLNNTGD